MFAEMAKVVRNRISPACVAKTAHRRASRECAQVPHWLEEYTQRCIVGDCHVSHPPTNWRKVKA
jgi:hypothetical protein